MADPILPDFFRAQVIFHGKTGAPEDVFVNNFVFRNDDVPGMPIFDVANAIQARLNAFYNTPPDGQSDYLAKYLNGNLLDTAATIKVYDLGDTPPRLPEVRPMTLGAMSAAASLPPEVAVCLSYYAGRPLPRRRGRIFLGPLTSSSVDISGNRTLVSSLLRETAKGAMEGLASNANETAPVRWHVLSQTDGNAFMITGGWVDNAHDTIRKRGFVSSGRTLWGAPPTS